MATKTSELKIETGPQGNLLSALPAPALATDAKGNVTVWNRAIEEWTGVLATDMVGKKVWTGFAKKKVITPVDLVLRFDEEQSDPEFTYSNRKSGKEQQVSFLASPVTDADGELVGVVASLCAPDHSEQIKAEMRRHRLFADASSDLVIVHDGSVIVDVSSQLDTLLGYQQADIIDTPLSRYFAAESADLALSKVRTGSDMLYEAWLMHRDGSKRLFQINSQKANIDEHEFSYLQLQDITEMKLAFDEAARALDDSAQKVKYLNKLANYVTITDLAGKIEFCNEAPLTAWDMVGDAVVGQNYVQLPAWSHDSYLQNLLEAAIEDAARGNEVELEVDAKEGDRIIPMKYSCSPLFNDRGDIYALVHTGTAILEQRTAMEDARQKVDYLNNIPIFVATMDVNGAINFVNNTAVAELGVAVGEVLHKPIWETPSWNHTDDVKTKLQSMVERAAAGLFAVEELDARTGDERLIPAKVSCSPLKKNDGSIYAILFSGTPIVEQRLALEALDQVREYQNKEVERLAASLQSLAAGNLDFDLTVSEGDDFTEDSRQMFVKINESVHAARLALIALTEDTNELVEAAIWGRLSVRADVSKHGGEYRRIVDGINSTLDAVITPLNVASEAITSIGSGDIPQMIKEEYKGDFNLIKLAINSAIGGMEGLREANRVLQKMAVNDLGEKVEGAYVGIYDEVGNAVNSVRVQLLTMTETATNIARGDLRDLDEYRAIGSGLGRMSVNDQLIPAFITMMENIQGMLDETNTLIAATQAGNLRVRGRVDLYTGGWRDIILGINAVIEPFHDAMVQVSEATDQVSSAASQIAAGSQAVSQGASEQAGAIEETSTGLEEMASMTRQNAEHSSQANEYSQKMRDAAGKGGQDMSKMMVAVKQIRQAAEGTSQIIKVINEIAFQTNLLALNAAVEAARAGDAGRGFAVVAEEVRNLAMRSKEAANKTEELIGESVKLTQDGEKISDKVGESLESIVESVSQVTAIIEEIAAASNQQARGIEQLNNAMAQMDQIVQQNVVNAEQSSSSAEELASQAQQLASMLGHFQLERERLLGSTMPGRDKPSLPSINPDDDDAIRSF